MKLPTLSRLREMSEEEAKALCSSLRTLLVDTVTRTGGHLASNLGIVEISVALARCMDLPLDKVLYDTGHQCYVHKILTGRGDAFSSLRSEGGISGFPRREESEFDPFGTGHSGTGISAALGLSRAMRLGGESGWCVAVIGDGAFTGGMVFEALNNISADDRLIIVLNDNGMSISKSVGRVKSALNRMRTAGYYRFKSGVRGTLSHLPLLGRPLSRLAQGIKDTVKRQALPAGNLFEEMGLHYFGPADGNDLKTVEFLLREAKKGNRPAVVHLCTKKGCGYEPAETDPARFHGVSPEREEKGAGKSASDLFGECLCRLAEQDARVCALTAAMTDGVGLSEFARRYPERFFDVGIAEEHAVTFAAALAAGGQKPCFAVYSTFYQRAVDQLLHDAALQKLPVVLALDRAGISGEDGATHHGLFDLPLTLPVPGVKIYAPALEGEMETYLRAAFAETESPSVIRYAKGAFSPLVAECFSGEAEAEVCRFGSRSRVQVVTFGRMTHRAILACREAQASGVDCTLIRFGVLKGFDPKAVASLFDPKQPVLFVEEGVAIGGFSHYLSHLLEREGICPPRAILAVEECFVSHGRTEFLLDSVGLSVENIRKEICRLGETGSVLM